MINFGRVVMFSTAPTFPFVAAIMSGYKVLGTKDKVRVFVSFLFLSFLQKSRSIQTDNTFLNIVTCRIDNASRT